MTSRSPTRRGRLAVLLTLAIIVGVTYLIAQTLTDQGRHVPLDTTHSRTPAVMVSTPAG